MALPALELLLRDLLSLGCLLLHGSSDKESAYRAGNAETRRYLEEEWQLATVSLPGKSVDRESWQATVHQVPNSQT